MENLESGTTWVIIIQVVIILLVTKFFYSLFFKSYDFYFVYNIRLPVKL